MFIFQSLSRIDSGAHTDQLAATVLTLARVTRTICPTKTLRNSVDDRSSQQDIVTPSPETRVTSTTFGKMDGSSSVSRVLQ